MHMRLNARPEGHPGWLAYLALRSQLFSRLGIVTILQKCDLQIWCDPNRPRLSSLANIPILFIATY